MHKEIKMDEIMKCYREQNVSEALLLKIERFREKYPVPEGLRDRLVKPEFPFY